MRTQRTSRTGISKLRPISPMKTWRRGSAVSAAKTCSKGKQRSRSSPRHRTESLSSFSQRAKSFFGRRVLTCRKTLPVKRRRISYRPYRTSCRQHVKRHLALQRQPDGSLPPLCRQVAPLPPHPLQCLSDFVSQHHTCLRLHHRPRRSQDLRGEFCRGDAA